MTEDTVGEDLNAQPFRPFVVTLNSGKTYEFRHPEMAKVTPGAFVLFTPIPGRRFAHSWETAGLGLIESISHVDLYA